MRVLLDTQIALWMALEPERLKVGERAIVAAVLPDVSVSVVSLWELRVKWNRRFSSGERKGPAEPAGLLTAWRNLQVGIVDLTAEMCVSELDPPFDHSDPFDQLLLAQAQQAGCRLLTRDEKIKAHPLALAA